MGLSSKVISWNLGLLTAGQASLSKFTPLPVVYIDEVRFLGTGAGDERDALHPLGFNGLSPTALGSSAPQRLG